MLEIIATENIDIEHAFESFDVDKDGFISVVELYRGLL